MGWQTWMPPLRGNNITPGATLTRTLIPTHTPTGRARGSRTPTPTPITSIIRITSISISRQVSISNNRWRHPPPTHPPIIPPPSSIICSCNPPRRHPCTNSSNSIRLGGSQRLEELHLTTEQVFDIIIYIYFLNIFLNVPKDLLKVF